MFSLSYHIVLVYSIPQTVQENQPQYTLRKGEKDPLFLALDWVTAENWKMTALS